MNKEIRPDKRLKTKSWLVLFTLSLFVLIGAVLIQVLVPLDKSVNPSELGSILWPITIGVLLLTWIITIPVTILWIKNLKYFIDKDKIIIFKGILNKVEKNIPFRNITDFVLQRTIYDRILGIGAVMIQTAGQSRNPSGYEGTLAGLLNYRDIHSQLKREIASSHGIVLDAKLDKNLNNQNILQEILQELKIISKKLDQ